MLGWLRRVVSEARGNAVWDFVKWGSVVVLAALVVLITRLLQHYRNVPSDLVVDGVLFVAILVFGALLIGLATVTRSKEAPTIIPHRAEPLKITSLMGQVFSSDGAPPHAFVQARNDENGREYVTATDPQGFFDLQITPGIYTLTVRCEGYYDQSHAVSAGHFVEFTLQKKE